MSRLLFPGKLKKGYLVKSPPLDGTAITKRFKAWKRRWCVLYLSDGKLYFQYYENEEKSHTGCPKNTLLLEECKEITFDLEHPEYDHVFSLTLPERTYYFSAVSQFEMTDWVDKIREPLDLKRAGSLKVQKSIRRSSTLDITNPLTPLHTPLLMPSTVPYPGGSQTLPPPPRPSTGGICITPPLPPRHSPTSPHNGPAGLFTIPRQHVAKTESIGSAEYPPLPIRNKLKDQKDTPPPLPPPHNHVKKQDSSPVSTTELSNRELPLPPLPQDQKDTPPTLPPPHNHVRKQNSSPLSAAELSNRELPLPPLPPKPLPRLEESDNDITPPEIPSRKTSHSDYVNYEICSKPPVPVPRTKKPNTNNSLNMI